MQRAIHRLARPCFFNTKQAPPPADAVAEIVGLGRVSAPIRTW
jgi:hypothetical protein